jgi:hypothetical protein
LVALGCLAALLFVSWIIHISEAPVTSPVRVSEAPRNQHVTAAMACALSIDDAGLLVQAYTHKDADAVLGLVERRKAIPLAAGTAVKVLVADSPYGGIDALYVESGAYIGERCYGVAALMAPD